MSDFVIKDNVLIRYEGHDSVVEVPDGVVAIGRDAFRICMSMQNVKFPASLVKIGETAFFHCDSLTSCTFPDGLIDIREGAFTWCSRLQSVVFPKSIKRIGQLAFAFTSLETVELPFGIERLDEGAFSRCKRLREINFPSSLRIVGDRVLRSSDGLSRITTDTLLPPTVIDTVLPGLRVVAERISDLPDSLRPAAAITFVEELANASGDTKNALASLNTVRATSHKDYIRRNAYALADAAFDNPELLRYMFRHKYLSASDIDTYIERAKSRNRIDMVILLTDYQVNVLGCDDDSFDDDLRNGLGIG